MTPKVLDLIDTAIGYCNQLNDLIYSQNSFLQFVENQEGCRKKWDDAEVNKVKFKSELDLLQPRLERKDNQVKNLQHKVTKLNENVASLEEKNHNLANQIREIGDLLGDPDNLSIEMRTYLDYKENDWGMSNTQNEELLAEMIEHENQINLQPPPPTNVVTKRVSFKNIESKLTKMPNLNGNSFIYDIDGVHIPSRAIDDPDLKGLDLEYADSMEKKSHLYSNCTGAEPNAVCTGCNLKIPSRAYCYKCDYCYQYAHKQCRVLNNYCPLAEIRLEDFIKSRNPPVPRFVKHCIAAIEKRGMNEVGLYRMSGNEKDVRECLDAFVHKDQIIVSKFNDIHVITNALKRFLSRLSEPLISNEFRAKFIVAAIKNDPYVLKNLLLKLPPPNLHTLTVLLVHLKKICSSKNSLMDPSNIAKVFAPTLISIGHPKKPTEIYQQVDQAKRVVEQLLYIELPFFEKVHSDYMISIEDWKQQHSKVVSRTPEAPHSNNFLSIYPTIECPMTENVHIAKKAKRNAFKIKRKLNFFGKKWELPR